MVTETQRGEGLFSATAWGSVGSFLAKSREGVAKGRQSTTGFLLSSLKQLHDRMRWTNYFSWDSPLHTHAEMHPFLVFTSSCTNLDCPVGHWAAQSNDQRDNWMRSQQYGP